MPPRHRRHLASTNPPPRGRALVRIMSALLGLSFGFAGGYYAGAPLKVPADPSKGTRGTAPATTGIPGMGAPFHERLAAAPLMNEDALRGLFAALQEEWVRQTGQADRPARTLPALRQIFSRWTDLSGDKALAAALEVRDLQLCALAVEAVMTEWGLRDALAASQTIVSIPWAEGQRRALLALLRAGVLRSPAEGLALAGKLPLAPQNLLRAHAGAVWLRRDASHALQFLSGSQELPVTVSAGYALGQWLLENPSGFFAWRREEPAAAKTIPPLRFLPGTASAGRLSALEAALVQEFGTLAAGLEWLQGAAGTEAVAVLQTLGDPAAAWDAEMALWAQSNNARQPAATAAGWLARASHAAVLRNMTALLARTQPEAALDRLVSLPAEEEAAPLAPVASLVWLEAAPATAAAKLFAADLKLPVRLAAALPAVDRMVIAAPQKFLESLPTLPFDAATSGTLQARALRQLGMGDAPALFAWLEAHPGVEAPAEALAPAMRSLALTDPARAMQWVRRGAPPAAAPALAGEVLSAWLRHDRPAAYQFLSTLPPGSERDRLTALWLEHDLAEEDDIFAANMLPESFDLALSLSDAADRTKSLRRVVERMTKLRISPQAVLSHPRLSPAERTALQP